MKRGSFVISIDTELAWGRPPGYNLEDYLPLIRRVDQVIPSLLKVFDEYQIPATWAIVGKLFLPEWDSTSENPIRGEISGPGLLDQILHSQTTHEIASHSFGHVWFDEIDEAEAERDIQQAIEAAQTWDLELRSFVFPRDQIGHTGVLARNGFTGYRGRNSTYSVPSRSRLQRAFNLIDLVRGGTLGGVAPRITDEGLVNTPSQLLFRVPHRGCRRWTPLASLVTSAKKGILAAVRDKTTYHLHFHPFNFGYRLDEHLASLARVLHFAAEQRQANKLETLTMKEISARVSAESRESRNSGRRP
jgi:hypothetical protein